MQTVQVCYVYLYNCSKNFFTDLIVTYLLSKMYFINYGQVLEII